MKPHIFREYDIRGLVGEDLTEEVAKDIGQSNRHLSKEIWEECSRRQR